MSKPGFQVDIATKTETTVSFDSSPDDCNRKNLFIAWQMPTPQS